MIISQIPNMPDNFEVVFFGDNQHGNIAEAEDKYLECIDYIRTTENCYGVHMGDICDAFWVSDPRYDPTTCKSPPLEQMKHQIEILTELVKTKRLLTILEGNHEHALQNKVGNFTNTLCEWLRLASGCAYPIAGTFTNKLELMTEKGTPMFKVYCTHGRKSITSISPDAHRKKAYLQFRLKRILEDMAGDCIVMVRGHCLSEDTEILASWGWAKYNELSEDDVILTFNTKTETAEWKQVERKFVYENEFSEMINFKSSTVDIMVTGDHRIITGRKNRKGIGYEPRNGRVVDFPKGVYKKGNKYEAYLRINKKVVRLGMFDDPMDADLAVMSKITEINDASFHWSESTADAILDGSNGSFVIPVCAPSGLLDCPLSDDWIRLLGWLISEGHFRKNGATQLFQSQSKDGEIRRILESLSIPYTIYTGESKGRKFNDPRTGKGYETKDNMSTFYIRVADSIPIRKLIMGKAIPDYAALFSDRQVKVFLEAMIEGDGSWNKDKLSGRYFTSDKVLADDLQALCVSHGIRASVRKRRNQQFVVNVRFTGGMRKTLVRNVDTWEKVKATPVSWCVSVPNGTIFTRRNGNVAVVGNSHIVLVTPPIPTLYLTSERGKIKQHYTKAGLGKTAEYIPPEHRFFGCSGSFLKSQELGVSTYSELAEYPPTEIGYLKLIVRDREPVELREVKV